MYINDPQTILELQKYPEDVCERVVVNFNDRIRIIKLRRDISQMLLLTTKSEIPLRYDWNKHVIINVDVYVLLQLKIIGAIYKTSFHITTFWLIGNQEQVYKEN